MGDTLRQWQAPRRCLCPGGRRHPCINAPCSWRTLCADALSVTELCALYGVSRKTGYKWIDRYMRARTGRLSRSSRAARGARRLQTPALIVDAILIARRRHPTWGPKKLVALLHRRQPAWSLPGRSTACAAQAARVDPPPGAARRIGHPGKPTSRLWRRTRSGARTSRASFGWATGGTAIRSP